MRHHHLATRTAFISADLAGSRPSLPVIIGTAYNSKQSFLLVPELRGSRTGVFIRSAAQGTRGSPSRPGPLRVRGLICTRMRGLLRGGLRGWSAPWGGTMECCSFIIINIWRLPKRVSEGKRAISSLGGVLEMLKFQNYKDVLAI